jgi:FHA domain
VGAVESPIAPHASTPAELKERIEAERSGDPYLVYRDSERHQKLRRLTTDEPRVTIGRNPKSDIALDWDREVSRLHAIVELVGGEWTIVDNGLSSNGSFVNGDRLTGTHRLEDGDQILVGQTPIVFRAGGASDIDSTVAAGFVPTRATISQRQREVLVALCRPYRDNPTFAIPATNDAIGAEVHLSVEAVKSHLRELFKKFGIEDLSQGQKRARLVAICMQSGLVSARDFESH